MQKRVVVLHLVFSVYVDNLSWTGQHVLGCTSKTKYLWTYTDVNLFPLFLRADLTPEACPNNLDTSCIVRNMK